MAQEPSRIRSALLEPAHLGGLVLALVLLVVFNFSTPILVGLAAIEAFYLLVFAQTAAYGRRIQLKAAQNALEGREQALELRAAALRRDERRRYQAISKLHGEVVRLLERGTGGSQLELVERRRLDELREAALEFCLALQSFREQLAKADPAKLRAELAQEAAVRELQEQRIQHLETMQAQSGTLDSQLQVIEQTFHLLKEQLSTLHAPTALPSNVGELVRDVEATRQTLREMQAFELANR